MGSAGSQGNGDDGGFGGASKQLSGDDPSYSGHPWKGLGLSGMSLEEQCLGHPAQDGRISAGQRHKTPNDSVPPRCVWTHQSRNLQ